MFDAVAAYLRQKTIFRGDGCEFSSPIMKNSSLRTRGFAQRYLQRLNDLREVANALVRKSIVGAIRTKSRDAKQIHHTNYRLWHRKKKLFRGSTA
jgi:hypothetical protein